MNMMYPIYLILNMCCFPIAEKRVSKSHEKVATKETMREVCLQIDQRNITDWLGNLMDSRNDEEALFVGHQLATKAAELLLAKNREWIGEGKWLYLALQKSADPKAKQLVGALKHLGRTGEKARMIEAIESVLKQVGGKLDEGYSEAG